MKDAFTLLELVFVIVVVSLLSTLFIRSIDTNNLTVATNQIATHIRYTRHLAMVNNIYDANEEDWYMKRWHINFSNAPSCGGLMYKVGSDKDLSNKDASTANRFGTFEAAVDPLTNKQIYVDTLHCNNNNVTKDWYHGILLGREYGIVSFTASQNCSQTIVFDINGRPYTGFDLSNPYGELMKNTCIYTITDNMGEKKTISIVPETGLVYIN